MLRHTRNFNPEWGYVAPVPSFMRTARLIVMAAMIGATAGAATVFSLLDRPAAEKPVAARTLVAPDASRPVTAGTSVAAQQPTDPQQIELPAEAQNPLKKKLHQRPRPGRRLVRSQANLPRPRRRSVRLVPAR